VKVTTRVSKGLSDRIREQRAHGRTEEINVIITLKKPVESSKLKAVGLRVTNVSQAGLWVAGAITSDNLDSLLKLPEVEQADLDGEIRAL
jgi:hypothetical protein